MMSEHSKDNWEDIKNVLLSPDDSLHEEQQGDDSIHTSTTSSSEDTPTSMMESTKKSVMPVSDDDTNVNWEDIEEIIQSPDDARQHQQQHNRILEELQLDDSLLLSTVTSSSSSKAADKSIMMKLRKKNVVSENYDNDTSDDWKAIRELEQCQDRLLRILEEQQKDASLHLSTTPASEITDRNKKNVMSERHNEMGDDREAIRELELWQERLRALEEQQQNGGKGLLTTTPTSEVAERSIMMEEPVQDETSNTGISPDYCEALGLLPISKLSSVNCRLLSGSATLQHSNNVKRTTVDCNAQTMTKNESIPVITLREHANNEKPQSMEKVSDDKNDYSIESERNCLDCPFNFCSYNTIDNLQLNEHIVNHYDADTMSSLLNYPHDSYQYSTALTTYELERDHAPSSNYQNLFEHQQPQYQELSNIQQLFSEIPSEYEITDVVDQEFTSGLINNIHGIVTPDIPAMSIRTQVPINNNSNIHVTSESNLFEICNSTSLDECKPNIMNRNTNNINNNKNISCNVHDDGDQNYYKNFKKQANDDNTDLVLPNIFDTFPSLVTSGTLESEQNDIKEPIISNKNYSCHFCDIIFKYEAMFTVHMSYHKHNNPYICKVCGCKYENKFSFFSHIACSKHE